MTSNPLPSCVDELVRAAITWALADRKADAAADEANAAAENRTAALEWADGDPTRIAQDILDQCSHASTALDIASVREQDADEAMREAAKRVARDLGL